MRLAPFILASIEPILADWESFARGLAPGKHMTKLALRNDAQHILRATVQDMGSDQTADQRERRSKGERGVGAASDSLDDSSALHGIARVGSGFDIREVVSEYRALRASVLRLWRRGRPQPDEQDVEDILRFNEAIDQSLAQAVASYSKHVEQSRQMFLAILSHDLRSPLNCIQMATQLIPKNDRDTVDAVDTISSNVQAVTQLVSDLIDFSAAGLGKGMPIRREPADLHRICREVLNNYRTIHPDRELRFAHHTDASGQWDAPRLRQVVSNLLGNALQHGAPDGPITLSLADDAHSVTLAVHNQGDPITPDAQPTLFDPYVRGRPDAPSRTASGSTGLGLYIVREIVHAHHGTITLTSSPDTGTTFTVRLPRK